MSDKRPTKPETMKPGSWWISVDRLISNAGTPDAAAWGVEWRLENNLCFKDKNAAFRAWYDETDQSGDCELVLRFERYDGHVIRERATLGPEIVVRNMAMEC